MARSPRLLAGLLPGALLVAAAVAVWAPALRGGFRYDDYGTVVLDSATRDASALLERLPRGVRPLTRISYALDHAAWGLAPTAFLATNLALHVAAALAVLALARRRLGSRAAAAVAGASFAVQPAHEVVAVYVSGRSAALSTALLLAALLAWERGTSRGTPRAARLAAWGASALFGLAVLARETALVFPLLLLWWEATRPSATEPFRRRVAPFALPASVALVLVVPALLLPVRYRQLFEASLALHGPAEALAENLRALPLALSLWFRPWALSIEHPPPPAGAAWLALGALVGLGLAAIALAARRRAPHLALAAGWVVIALLPTHSLIARGEALTERPLYLAWVGPALLAGAAALALARAARPALAAAAAAGLVLALGGAAADRARLWADEAALWEDAVVKAPASARAWNNLGTAHLAARQYGAARAAFHRALALDPDHASARANLAGLALVTDPAPQEGGTR